MMMLHLLSQCICMVSCLPRDNALLVTGYVIRKNSNYLKYIYVLYHLVTLMVIYTNMNFNYCLSNF